MSFKKLFKPEQFCVLNPEYFKIVMESASVWAALPYSTKNAVPAWHRKNIFSKKITGYIMTGFKLDFPKKSTGSEIIDFFDSAPIKMLFVPNDCYLTITSIKSKGCIVEATEYGVAKTWQKEYGKWPTFCLSVSSFVKEINEKELREIKAVDAIVGGY